VTHGRTLYREVVHVPLVLAGPGIPRGTRVDVPVSNRHVAPTLARLMGGDLPAVTDALNLAALDADPPQPERALIFSTTQGWWNGQHPQELLGLRRGAWVLQYAPQGGPWGSDFPGPGEMRLFDVRADPGETIDLSKEWDAVARGMLQILETRKAALVQRSHAVATPGGESTLQTLRGLGYLDDE
jgi:choline-sulfatase